MHPVPLTPRVLEYAYSQGYFPMSDPDTGETHWYRPDPRTILPLEGFHVSHSLARTLKKGHFSATYNQAFTQVMAACADRPEGSWINQEFLDAYSKLHEYAKAHSVEVWCDSHLVGGVYGVSLGAAFFAESKFHTQTDASKVALWHLVQRLRHCGYTLLEVQFMTPHLQRLGAIEIPDSDYAKRLQNALQITPLRFTP